MQHGICPLPFTQLFLNPDGRITPCCYLAQKPYYQVGDIQKQTLEEIWNGEPMRALRREFLSGEPKICEFQIKASNCNRIRRDLLEHAVLQETLPFPMARLDLMLNGKCNLECVTCGVWTLPNDVYTANGFWDQGREKIFPHLIEIDAKGGEPFIQKDIFRLIDEVSAVNSKVSWHFTTNGHYRFNEKIRSAVSKIRIARLSLSIDSLDPEKFTAIRKKGSLATALRTLDDWIAYRNESPERLEQVNVNFVVQRANWAEVPDFYEFCRKKGVAPFYIILTDPDCYSVLTMPLEDRIEAVSLLFSAMRKHRDRVFYRVLRPLLGSLPFDRRDDVLRDRGEQLLEMSDFGPSIAEVRV